MAGELTTRRLDGTAEDEWRYLATIPANDAMGSVPPNGQYVICERREPKDVDVVFAHVLTSLASEMPGQYEIDWHSDAADHARLQYKGRTVLRRYGHDAEGREVLTADYPAYPPMTAGNQPDDRHVEYYIPGVRVTASPIMHNRGVVEFTV